MPNEENQNQQSAIQKFFERKGLTVLPDSKQWINRFEIRSESSNRLYIIAQKADKSGWGCSCPAWITRRKCKHLTSIMPLIQQAENQ